MSAAEVKCIAHAAFAAVREIDAANTSGLCNYVACSPFAGRQRKEEAAITWGLTEALQKQWRVTQRESAYPQGSDRCDRVIELEDGTRLWLEVKLAG